MLRGARESLSGTTQQQAEPAVLDGPQNNSTRNGEAVDGVRWRALRLASGHLAHLGLEELGAEHFLRFAVTLRREFQGGSRFL
jgi:hypothetical protein